MTNDCQGPQDPPGIGAMKRAMNCALANRRILAHLTRKCFTRLLPHASRRLPGLQGVRQELARMPPRMTVPVFASRGWHPGRHCSFRAQGDPCLEHDAASTPGAEFAAGLALPPAAVIISKTMRESADLEMQQAGAAPMKFEDWGQ
jgi:hypothetical protein